MEQEPLMDAGAERAVLAGLLNYGLEAYIEISDFIEPGSFVHHSNAVIYKCLEKVLKEGNEVDLPSIVSAAERLNLVETIGSKQELEYIHMLTQYHVSKKNVPAFALKVKKYQFARKIRRLARNLAEDIENITGDESISEIIGMLEDPVTELVREDSSSQTPERIGEDIMEYVDFLIENKCDQIGISSGYPIWDASIGGGLRRGAVDLIAARPKVGKSIFTSNVGIFVAKQNIPVLILDTEMKKDDQRNRMMSNLAGITINDVATGHFEEEEKLADIMKAAKGLEEIPLDYINVSGESMENILNIIKRWVIRTVGVDEEGKTNDCLVIYDYLKLMGGLHPSIQEFQRLGEQITDLHNLSVKYDFACMAFAQLNRDGATEESTTVVSGSDRLIWLCTSFSIFKKKSVEEIAQDGINAGNRKLVPIIGRHGPAMEGGNYINMRMQGEYARITELQTRDELVVERESRGGFEGADEALEGDTEQEHIDV